MPRSARVDANSANAYKIAYYFSFCFYFQMREYIFWGLIIASFPLIFRNPYWGIVLYSGLNLIRPEMFFWGGRANNKAGFYVFAVTVICTFFKGKLKLSQSRYYLFLLLWVYAGLKVSIYLSGYHVPRADYYADENVKIFLLCFLVASLVDSEEKVKNIQNIFLGCLTFLGIWAIDQNYSGNVRLENFNGMDSNGVASFFVTFLPLAYCKFFTAEEKKAKLFGALAVVAILLAIIFTLSRGGFLGLICATFFWIMSFKEKKRVLLYFTVAMFFVVPLAGHTYMERMKTMAGDEETGALEGSAHSRLILWRAGIMIFSDNPWFGTGYMSYPHAKMEYEYRFTKISEGFRNDVFRTWQPRVTHNTYIQLLSDGGLFLSVPYFLFLISTFWANHKVKRKVVLMDVNKDLLNLLLAIEAGIVGYCVTIIFINSITSVFLPVQVIISSIIRNRLYEQMKMSDKTGSLPRPNL